ncbi:MAG: MarR family winged helix-turn-helix transcriptional regulator [Oscillospiraceae bacterium]
MDTQGGFYISQIKQLQDRVFFKLLKEQQLDINSGQGRILFVLWKENPLTIGEIGQKTSLANASLTGMLDRLEEKGFVTRQHMPNDRRQTQVCITPKCSALQQQYNAVSQEMNALFYTGFTEQEIQVFEAGLKHCLQNLQAYLGQKGENLP